MRTALVATSAIIVVTVGGCSGKSQMASDDYIYDDPAYHEVVCEDVNDKNSSSSNFSRKEIERLNIDCNNIGKSRNYKSKNSYKAPNQKYYDTSEATSSMNQTIYQEKCVNSVPRTRQDISGCESLASSLGIEYYPGIRSGSKYNQFSSKEVPNNYSGNPGEKVSEERLLDPRCLRYENPGDLVTFYNQCDVPIQVNWCWVPKGRDNCVINSSSNTIPPRGKQMVHGPGRGDKYEKFASYVVIDKS